jgi:hypothetical protein
MADNYGVSFAPTQENAQQGPLNAQIDGLPAAIKILALRFPRILGANPVAPPDLLNAPGAQGIDPVASAVLATMARAIATHNMNVPGGTAGPALGPVAAPPFPSPSPLPGSFPTPPTPAPFGGSDIGKPRIIPQDGGVMTRNPLGGFSRFGRQQA